MITETVKIIMTAENIMKTLVIIGSKMKRIKKMMKIMKWKKIAKFK